MKPWMTAVAMIIAFWAGFAVDMVRRGGTIRFASADVRSLTLSHPGGGEAGRLEATGDDASFQLGGPDGPHIRLEQDAKNARIVLDGPEGDGIRLTYGLGDKPDTAVSILEGNIHGGYGFKLFAGKLNGAPVSRLSIENPAGVPMLLFDPDEASLGLAMIEDPETASKPSATIHITMDGEAPIINLVDLKGNRVKTIRP